MRRRLLIVTMLGALSAGAGCASSQVVPAPSVADTSSDPSWIPPGQGELAVADSPIEEKPKAKPRARRLQEPNHRKVDSHALQANSSGPRP